MEIRAVQTLSTCTCACFNAHLHVHAQELTVHVQLRLLLTAHSSCMPGLREYSQTLDLLPRCCARAHLAAWTSATGASSCWCCSPQQEMLLKCAGLC